MLADGLIKELDVTEQFFFRTIEPLTADDALFRPNENLYTIASHIDHVADSINWFIEGAFKRDDGFDMHFEVSIEKSQQQTDFDAAVQLLKQAFNDARQCVSEQSDEALMSPLPEGPIMGGAPRLAVISGIVDHTAHHRGALAVYCRLLDKEPPMPYA